MRGRGWGRVINIASATVAIPSPVSIAYRTAKMGTIGFTRALTATLGDEGITINAVPPSLTRTAMTEGIPQPIVDASLSRPGPAPPGRTRRHRRERLPARRRRSRLDHRPDHHGQRRQHIRALRPHHRTQASSQRRRTEMAAIDREAPDRADLIVRNAKVTSLHDGGSAVADRLRNAEPGGSSRVSLDW
jgi:hypothetical protein